MSNSLWPPWTTVPLISLSSSISQFAQIHVHLSQWHYLTISSSASPFSFDLSLSQHQGLFQWVSFPHHVAKVLEHQSFQSFSISPSKEYSGLISFRIDWLDLHAVQGTVKNLLQHHDLKASILRHLVSLRYKFHISTLVMEKTQQWLYWLLLAKWCLCFWIWCLGLS